MGEMHALITLDSGEVRRVIIPQAIALPRGMANSYLLAVTPFLIADHKYTCRLDQPRLQFKGGGTYTMDVNKGHHILNITPIKALTDTPHKEILLHRREPYDPPTFHNHSTMTQNTNRRNTKTPTAFIYHYLRFACASEVVLKRTQGHVIGMEVQLGSWNKLKDNASEYLHGDFATIGKEKGIKQVYSAPNHPNQNPTEHYMDLIMSKARCLLYISGLDPTEHWEHALTHSVGLQTRLALPGRNTPYQYQFGHRPDISHIRIFGCAALA